jgi:hypothetical protein
MAHNNLESLKEAILKKAKKGMKEAVLPYVQDKMVESIDKVVYDAYNPIQYTDRRKYHFGGLADKSRIIGFSIDTNGGFDYIIRNIAKGVNKDVELTPLIVKGQTWALLNRYPLIHDKIVSYEYMYTYNKAGFTPYYMPRDFIAETKKNIDRAVVVGKLQAYMNRK